MPSYKLTYFNAKGSAEVIRFIFAQGGVKYEDVRVKVRGEQWKEMKPTTPFGVLPVLEVDGKQLGGSLIIGRYLAEMFGLSGDSPFENAQIANIVDAVYDFNQEFTKMFFEQDETRKAEMMKKLKEEVIPTKLQFFEKRASTNDSGWLYAGKLTWADFCLYLSLEWAMKTVSSEFMSNFPGLTKMRASVEALPNIAKWIKERPVTEH